MQRDRADTAWRPRAFLADQREFFNRLVVEERDSYRDSSWARARQYEVDRLFELVSPETVLDVGCGCGFHDAAMADKSGVREVVGIDYSDASVRMADEWYPHPRVSRSVADVYELPAGEYDLVTTFQVVEHQPDPERFLRACARQVRQGGSLFVATPNRVRFDNRIRMLARRPPALADTQHFVEFSLDDLERVGHRIGLTRRATFGYGLTATVPKLGRRLLRPRPALRAGSFLPAVADVVCVLFDVGTIT